ncbi:MAG: hypothetical protein IKU95_00900, partial [Clostridia bacterium]|nr:hypothetical protein [Clostridia bacterium]
NKSDALPLRTAHILNWENARMEIPSYLLIMAFFCASVNPRAVTFTKLSRTFQKLQEQPCRKMPQKQK